MSIERIINAWRDSEYRENLTEEEQALLPENPAGSIALNDVDLANIAGGTDTEIICSAVSGAISAGVLSAVAKSALNGGTCQMDTSGCCH